MPNQRSEHDPLCPWPAPSRHPNHCQCDLIARVSERVALDIEKDRDRMLGASIPGPIATARAVYDRAARIAREGDVPR